MKKTTRSLRFWSVIPQLLMIPISDYRIFGIQGDGWSPTITCLMMSMITCLAFNAANSYLQGDSEKIGFLLWSGFILYFGMSISLIGRLFAKWSEINDAGLVTTFLLLLVAQLVGWTVVLSIIKEKPSARK